jgi:hypothetical protein
LYRFSLEAAEKNADCWNAELQQALKDKKNLGEKKAAVESELVKLKFVRANGSYVLGCLIDLRNLFLVCTAFVDL